MHMKMMGGGDKEQKSHVHSLLIKIVMRVCTGTGLGCSCNMGPK